MERALGALAEEPASNGAWWESQRGYYNWCLVKVGLLAGMQYCAVGWFLAPYCLPIQDRPEITLFSLLFQGIGYLIMMLLAISAFSSGRCPSGWSGRHLRRPFDGSFFGLVSGSRSYFLS